MATTFNFRIKPKAGPLYKQVADYFRQEIRKGHISSHSLLPSIRALTSDLKISRTTAESAYELLIDEGYVTSIPGKGYQVEQFLPARPKEKQSTQPLPELKLRYDFSNNYIDTSTFDTSVWRRCLNTALRNPGSIAGYGSHQGELALRQVLAAYSYSSRGVVTTPEQIVIGAGLQSLLSILLPILPLQEKIVGLEQPGFPQAEETFKNNGWQVKTFMPSKPRKDWPQLLMVSPSNPYKGRALSEEERTNLIIASKVSSIFILEDDYNGEFRYLSTPTSALHSFGNSEQIIYVGSFSRTLLPSLRISYMVLPKELLPRYREKMAFFNQTSSTLEQLALAEYIGQGHLARHVKKLRSLYKAKNTLLRTALTSTFGSKVKILDYASGMHLRISLAYPLTPPELAAKALKQGIKIIPIPRLAPPKEPEVLLSFAGIGQNDIPQAIKALKKALEA